MAATTADRTNATTYTNDAIPFPVAASTTVYAYENVGINTSGGNSGYITPISAIANLYWIGYALYQGNNSAGAAGAVYTPVVLLGNGPDNGLFLMDCTNAQTTTWLGQIVYFTDDHTVGLSGANSVIAGMVVQILGGINTNGVITGASNVVVNSGRRAL
jgi:hypothetical protein